MSQVFALKQTYTPAVEREDFDRVPGGGGNSFNDGGNRQLLGPPVKVPPAVPSFDAQVTSLERMLRSALAEYKLPESWTRNLVGQFLARYREEQGDKARPMSAAAFLRVMQSTLERAATRLLAESKNQVIPTPGPVEDTPRRTGAPNERTTTRQGGAAGVTGGTNQPNYMVLGGMLLAGIILAKVIG